MAQRGEWPTSNCMLCHICIEDTNHITACRSSLANITRIDAALQATQKLQELDTDPDILTIFTKALCKPTNGSMVFSCPHTTDSNIILQHACKDQDQIGHIQFLQGMIATTWQQAQEEYYYNIESSKTSKTWAVKVVNILHQFLHSIWITRCEITHKRKMEILTQKEHREVAQRIQYEKDNGLGDLTPNFQYLQVEAENISNASLDFQYAWLEELELARCVMDGDSPTISIKQLRETYHNSTVKLQTALRAPHTGTPHTG